MATPMTQNIIDNRVAALALITTAGGYNYDWAEAPSTKFRWFDACNAFPVAFVSDGDEIPADPQPMAEMKTAIELIVDAYISDESDIVAARQKLKQDIMRAFWQDVTCGGYAINQELVSVQSDANTLAPIGWVKMTVRITFGRMLADVQSGAV